MQGRLGHLFSPLPSRPSWRLLALGLALLANLSLGLQALADLVHLNNGKVIQGEVIEENDRFVVVRVPFGQIKLRAEEVEFIERQTPQEYRLELGRDYLKQKKFGPAIEELEKALAVDRDSAEARLVLAQAFNRYGTHLCQIGRLAEAKTYFVRLQSLQKDAPEAAAGLAAVGAAQSRLRGLLDQARASLAAQDLDSAIAGFLQAIEFSPDAREQAGPELARCWAARAGVHYKGQRFEEAAADLERAFGLEPNLANEMEGLYTASALSATLRQLSAGKVAEAKAGLARVITFAPTQGLVRYVAGRLEEALGNLKGAAENYGRILKTRPLGATPAWVAVLRAKAEAELRIPDGGARLVFNVQPSELAAYAQSTPGKFESLETAHFAILHHNQALATETGAVLEAHYARILAETGLQAEWREKPKVFLHRTHEEYALATGQAAWTGGVSRFTHLSAGGLARMEIHSWQTSPRLLKSVVPHELTHLIVNTNLPSYAALPRCLHEGFSVLMEPEFRRAYFLQFLRMRLNGKEFIPLADLLAMKDYPRDPDVYYAEGYGLVAYLVQKQGLSKTLGLVRDAGKKTVIEDELKALTGEASLDRLETGWKAWIQTP